MRIGLIDASYKRPGIYGLGISWLQWELRNLGVEPSPIEAADVIFASVQSQQCLPDLKRELKRAGVDWRQRPVVIGGGGAYAPAVFDGVAAAACVGEGRRFVQTFVRDGYDAALALPETWQPGGTREVIPSEEFPWDCPPVRFQDGTTRLWVSRGCSRKCLFCQTGWESSYRQRPDMESVYQQATALVARGEKPFYTSNDQSELDWARLPKMEHLSATVDGIRAIVADGRVAKARSIRVGVEGVSERLRRAVGKPMQTDDLVKLSMEVMAHGVTLRWFFIAGLPGETAEDYADLRDAVMKLKRHCQKGAVMMHFHAFLPHPAAPLSVLPISDDDYWSRFEEFRRWFFDGPGATTRVQIVACAQPKTRMEQACMNMACSARDIRRGWADCDNANWRIQYACDNDKRRRLARRYAERTGILGKKP
jgi:radical SAM superfamily enzyme YgiQ (UPF0313 family)